jgi:anaerobic glycerol-3-phosphate dehydrogenase
MSASEYDAAIIGSGVGSLTCGALLAHWGKKVISANLARRFLIVLFPHLW